MSHGQLPASVLERVAAVPNSCAGCTGVNAHPGPDAPRQGCAPGHCSTVTLCAFLTNWPLLGTGENNGTSCRATVDQPRKREEDFGPEMANALGQELCLLAAPSSPWQALGVGEATFINMLWGPPVSLPYQVSQWGRDSSSHWAPGSTRVSGCKCPAPPVWLGIFTGIKSHHSWTGESFPSGTGLSKTANH